MYPTSFFTVRRWDMTGLEVGGAFAISLGLIEIIKALIKKLSGNGKDTEGDRVRLLMNQKTMLELQKDCVRIVQESSVTQRMIADTLDRLERKGTNV
jgi:ATP phosphoribosyltransferase regulatory subunit HisZ